MPDMKKTIRLLTLLSFAAPVWSAENSLLPLSERLLPLPARAVEPVRPGASVSGPVVTLDYSGKNSIPIADFLYFVPLISPEPMTISESPTNTLQVRLDSIRQEVRTDRFLLNLAFDVSGQGFRHYAIDQSENIRRHKRRLEAGQTLKTQLDYIRYEGPGKGRVEIDGKIENGVKTILSVRLHFDDRGGASPVTVGLKNMRSTNGVILCENELVACGSLLAFTRDGTPPRMGVRVDSVKDRQAGDGFFQNLKGQIVGRIANTVIKPIAIRKIGNDTLLDFGQALLDRKPTYTFPAADNLKAPSPDTLTSPRKTTSEAARPLP